MTIEINKNGFTQATSLLGDILFKHVSTKQSEGDLQKLKLLQARHNNIEFELTVSEFICGDNTSFPYRKGYQLTKFFGDLGLPFIHDGSTRKYWVRDTLLLLNIHDLSLVLRRGLFNKRDFRKHAKEHNLDFEELYQNAVHEFKILLNESLESDNEIDLSYLLDLNVNVELLFEREIKTKDDELDSLIKEAKERFFKPNDKQIAVEKLWDAFERIKTYFDSNKKQSSNELVKLASHGFDFELIEQEFKSLTTIGNSYKIRHHEIDKKDISNPKHIDYLFFRMLSLLDLCIKSINEKQNSISSSA